MPSRKIVLREERGNRLQLEKQESAQKPLYLGNYPYSTWVHTLFFQTAASTNAGSERPLFSNFINFISRHTSPQLKGRATDMKVLSPSLFKDRKRAPPKSLHGPESAVYSTRSFDMHPYPSQKAHTEQKGTCAALNEKSQETSLEYLRLQP